MRVLVIGATGFIGSAIVARLLASGHAVKATSRDPGAPRVFGAEWITVDFLSATPEDWAKHLKGVEAVVNCAGVLQDSRADSTEAVHHHGPAALFAACEKAGVRRIIHFSAIGVDRQTPTKFSRTKAQGEAALMATGLEWIILRPSVVVGHAAFGGSALFRGLAALPVIPSVAAGKLQVVQLDDVVSTVVFFLDPASPTRIDLDVAGPEPLSFNEIVAAYRRWLGWKPAVELRTPIRLMNAMYRFGDLAGWLGWRPAIRSTAQREIVRGAVGDIARWTTLTGIAPRSLRNALVSEPASVQERWFARLYFLKPVVLVVFSAFWTLTALIALVPGWRAGLGLMNEAGVGGLGAPLIVMAGALADLVIGLGVAFRRSARPALYAAVLLSLVYVILGTVLAPRLWIDPLGPLLKTWPVIALNLIAIAIVDDR